MVSAHTPWRGGLRYPTLERDDKRRDLLTAIFSPLAAGAPTSERTSAP
jgi:hypothetical protein